MSQAVKLKGEYGENGPDGLCLPISCPELRRLWHDMLTAAVVAYQFAKIGNDQAAQDLVQRLDDDEKLGDYIDCMGTFSGCDGHRLFIHGSY